MKPCPTCNKAPETRTETNNQVVVFCAQHGHMALGDDRDSAIYHWNMYVLLLGKAA